MTISKKKEPSRRELKYLTIAVRDAYLGFDQEDYCNEGIKRCDNCVGCIQYNNLRRAYRISKKFIKKP